MMARWLGVAAVLAFFLDGSGHAQVASDPAANQAAAPSAAASAVGHWLYDVQGNIVGSVRGLADGGRTAVIMVGSYFQPGSHEARVPARALSITDGRATLEPSTMEAVNAVSRR